MPRDIIVKNSFEMKMEKSWLLNSISCILIVETCVPLVTHTLACPFFPTFPTLSTRFSCFIFNLDIYFCLYYFSIFFFCFIILLCVFIHILVIDFKWNNMVLRIIIKLSKAKYCGWCEQQMKANFYNIFPQRKNIAIKSWKFN